MIPTPRPALAAAVGVLLLAPSAHAQVTIVGGPARATSIAIGADGLGFIAYYDPDTTHLIAAHCRATSM
jgi:hypothetical protein